jgi:hypothetical protein
MAILNDNSSAADADYALNKFKEIANTRVDAIPLMSVTSLQPGERFGRRSRGIS